MAKPKSKQVDLVIYKGGERILVGRADISEDGRVEAQIAKDLRKDVKDLVYGDMLDNLSFNPKPSPGPFKYHEATVTPKIQE